MLSDMESFRIYSFKILLGFLLMLSAASLERAQNVTAKMPVSANEPRLFEPGVISTGDYEGAEEFSPDGKTLYYLKLTPDFDFWTIVFSRFENGRWTQPQVAPFSGQYIDGDPFITADGERMFFISNRPGPNSKETQKFNIYVMNRTASERPMGSVSA